MPIYVSVALISERRKEVLNCEQEMPYLHKLLNILPDDLNINRILDTARSLFERYPPYLVQGELHHEYKKVCKRHWRDNATNKRLKKLNNTMKALSKVSRYNVPLATLGFVGATSFVLWISKNYLNRIF